jgi:hypothetical protein
LDGILHDLDAGVLAIDENAEDIHMLVEAELTKRIGDAGKQLDTARSRNDQVALDIRLYLREKAGEVIALIENLVKAIESLPKGAFWDLSISTAPKIDVFFPIMCTTLLYIAIPFIVAIAYDIFAKFTYEKELEAVKAIYAYYAKKGIPVSKNEEESEADAPVEESSSLLFDLKNNWVKIFKYSVLVLSVLLIVFGIVSGNLEAILNNAIKICTGCIGLE